MYPLSYEEYELLTSVRTEYVFSSEKQVRQALKKLNFPFQFKSPKHLHLEGNNTLIFRVSANSKFMQDVDSTFKQVRFDGLFYKWSEAILVLDLSYKDSRIFLPCSIYSISPSNLDGFYDIKVHSENVYFVKQ